MNFSESKLPGSVIRGSGAAAQGSPPERSGQGGILMQVVPQRTSEPNGVADYALTLARTLRDSQGIDSVFLSAGPLTDGQLVQEDWRTVVLTKQTPDRLADAILLLSAEMKAQAVLLHLSGYGYQKRGVPLWLARGLEIWRELAPRTPLFTVFHELYAFNRPWNSSFWLSPIQRQIARRILRVSSHAITPTGSYMERLLRWGASDTEVAQMPVFSNIGEPGQGRVPLDRPATAVVFGLAGVEECIYGTYRAKVEGILGDLGVTTLFDVGPRFSSNLALSAVAEAVQKGVLPVNALSTLLQQARFGLIAYPFGKLGKSGVFAAYAAHGVVPIVLAERREARDGLEPDRHFVDGLRLNAGRNASDLAAIQRELYSWYGSHGAKVQAAYLRHLLNLQSFR